MCNLWFIIRQDSCCQQKFISKHWAEIRWPSFRYRHSQINYGMKSVIFWSSCKFLGNMFPWVQLTKRQYIYGNGLVHNKWQAITWAKIWPNILAYIIASLNALTLSKRIERVKIFLPCFQMRSLPGSLLYRNKLLCDSAQNLSIINRPGNHMVSGASFTNMVYPMMTSSNGNILRVTGHSCAEFTGPRWIPRTKASDAELWCFLWSAPE